MSAERYAVHLRARVLELWSLPLRAIHEDTGLPVYLLLALVCDAYARVEDGKIG